MRWPVDVVEWFMGGWSMGRRALGLDGYGAIDGWGLWDRTWHGWDGYVC